MPHVAPKDNQSRHGLCGDPACRIQQHVSDSRRASGHKRLVKLVEGRIASHDHDRSQSPGEPRIAPSRANPPQDQQAENKIFGEVRCLADEVMNLKEDCVRERVAIASAKSE